MRKLLILFLIFIVIYTFSNSSERISPPDAKKKKHVTEIHGHKLVDYYHWLKKRDNQEVIDYIKKENKYTEKKMKHTEKLQQRIYDEIIKRIDETDLTVPEKHGNYYYYSRTEKGKQYKIYCRKKGSLDAKEEVILNVNKMAEGHDYYDLGVFKISPNHKLLAFTYDTKGSERYNLRIKNLKKGKILDDRIDDIDDFVWANDNKTFFYTVQNSANRPYKLYKHRLNQKSKEDPLLYKEEDEKYWMWVSKSKSDDYIFMGTASKTTSEMYYTNADMPGNNFTLIKKRETGVEYYPYHNGKYFYILTNKNAYNFKVMRTPVGKCVEANWKTFIPHRKNIYIQDLEVFKDYMVLSRRKNSYKRLSVLNIKSKIIKEINFPEKLYNFWLGSNYEYETNKLRLTYTSYLTPKTVYDYNMKKNTLNLRKQYNVKGYDKSDYESKRIFIKSFDNTRVPVSLVYRKDMNLKDKNPLLLHGYGAYGSSLDPYFSYSRISMLNRGIVYATAHVRGGSEMGIKWYEEGKLLNKKNSFKDFVSCSESLIDNNYTSRDNFIITGGSAGGLLIGTVVNMRPELFEAAVLSVPFVDLINTMLDSSLPLTVVEYEEWGNPEKKENFEYMLSYSPYDNIINQKYPHMLVTGGLNDTRVQYWEPTKYAAKLRDYRKGKSRLLLKINMGSGHMGASGRYDYYKDIAFEYAFILEILDITE